MFGRFSKILVVDDNPAQRRTTRGFLNALGFDNIEEAPEGRTALAMLEKFTYRLVVAEYDIRPMNGFQLLRTMRADPRMKRIPFIMATTQIQRKFFDIARDEGTTHYLLKPLTAAMLGERISKLERLEVA